MKVIHGLKDIYKDMNWYNRRKLIEANRMFEFMEPVFEKIAKVFGKGKK